MSSPDLFGDVPQVVPRPRNLEPPPAPGPDMSWANRIANYERVLRRPAYITIAPDGWVYGMWLLGQNFQKKNEYYGGFQGDTLKRFAALMPDKRCVLYPFSGMVDHSILPGDTVDIRPELNPTFVDDCQTLEGVPVERYDLAIVDPPYSAEDAEHYGTTMVDRRRVMHALERLPAGAHVIWLDQVSPMYSSATFRKEALIGVTGSINHRFRVVTVFRRRSP